MTTDFRALCAELVSKIDYTWGDIPDDARELMDRARALLAQPEGEGLTDEELEVIASQFCDFCHAHMSSPDEWWCSRSGLTAFTRAAIAADRARYGRPTLQPPAEATT